MDGSDCRLYKFNRAPQRVNQSLSINLSTRFRQAFLVKSPSQEPESEFLCICCTEEFESSGAHQICSLKCGHLFGKCCIETWHSTKSAQNKMSQYANCPLCNKLYKKTDIRLLCTRNFRALDISAREEFKKMSQQFSNKSTQLNKELTRSKVLHSLVEIQKNQALQELELLKKQLSTLQDPKSYTVTHFAPLTNSESNQTETSCPEAKLTENTSSPISVSSNVTINQDITIVKAETLENSFTASSAQLPCDELSITLSTQENIQNSSLPSDELNFIQKILHTTSQETPFKTLAYSSKKCVALVSSKIGPSNYGVTYIDLNNFQVRSGYLVHQGEINDLELGIIEENDIVLSVGMDSTMKLTNPNSTVIIASFPLSNPGWSCCFNSYNTCLLYTGTAEGEVVELDISVPGVPSFRTLSFPEITSNSPIHSLYHVEKYDVLLGANHNGVYVWLPRSSFHEPRCFKLPNNTVSAKCKDLIYDSISGFFVASYQEQSSNTILHQAGCLEIDFEGQNNHSGISSVKHDIHFEVKYPITKSTGCKPRTTSLRASKVANGSAPLIFLCVHDESKGETQIWDISDKRNIGNPFHLKSQSFGPPLAYELCLTESDQPDPRILALTSKSVLLLDELMR